MMEFLKFSKSFGGFFLGFYLLFDLNPSYATAFKVDVAYLTQSGSTILKSLNAEYFSKSHSGRSSSREWSAQNLLFEESASGLALDDRASIDVVTIISAQKTIRVPRFLIWRGFFVFQWNPKTSSLSSKLKRTDGSRILVPSWYFEVDQIQRIELTNHETLYPKTKLKVRTNPAASRGEKIFVQNCLACHSVPTYGAPPLEPTQLSVDRLKSFQSIHKKWSELKLDPRFERGLAVYAEALALEKNEVKPKP